MGFGWKSITRGHSPRQTDRQKRLRDESESIHCSIAWTRPESSAPTLRSNLALARFGIRILLGRRLSSRRDVDACNVGAVESKKSARATSFGSNRVKNTGTAPLRPLP